jgi:hypothetical protein
MLSGPGRTGRALHAPARPVALEFSIKILLTQKSELGPISTKAHNLKATELKVGPNPVQLRKRSLFNSLRPPPPPLTPPHRSSSSRQAHRLLYPPPGLLRDGRATAAASPLRGGCGGHHRRAGSGSHRCKPRPQTPPADFHFPCPPSLR